MTGRRTPALLVVAAGLCLLLALCGQAMADALVSDASGADTTRAIGRAANSYLTGLRTYAAAALWNRIDSLMHGYYSGVGLDDQRYMLSTIAVVQALDPTAVQAYYVGEWLLVKNGRVADGMAMARSGVDNNPQSGIVLTGYAQLLSLYGDDASQTVSMAERAIGSDIHWTDATEQLNAYAALGTVFRTAGRADLDSVVQAKMVSIESQMDPLTAPVDHDHDGDGVPDH